MFQNVLKVNMSFPKHSKLTEEDFLDLSNRLGENLEMAQKIGFEPTAYFILAKAKNEFIQRPSEELRRLMGINRTTEWRYRKALKGGGYI